MGESRNDRELAYPLAQLRHAYENLIRPGPAWEHAQRVEFADGLLAPQIRALESVARRIAAEDER